MLLGKLNNEWVEGMGGNQWRILENNTINLQKKHQVELVCMCIISKGIYDGDGDDDVSERDMTMRERKRKRPQPSPSPLRANHDRRR